MDEKEIIREEDVNEEALEMLSGNGEEGDEEDE